MIELEEIVTSANDINVIEKIIAEFGRSMFFFHLNKSELTDEIVMHAFKNCSVESFENLLNNGFNPSSTNQSNSTIVHVLCQLKLINLGILNLFLRHPQYNPNIMNYDHHTILNLLCTDTLIDDDLKCEMVINILEHPGINDYSLNKGCLHDACNTENIKLVRLLLSDDRINPNEQNRLYQYPIDCVYRTYNFDLLTFFCKNPRVTLLCGTDISLASIPSNGETINKSFADISYFIDFMLKNLNLSHDKLIFFYIRTNNVDLLKIILSFKNLIININRYCPFHISNYEILEILMQDGRFDSLVFENGTTFYHHIFHDRPSYEKMNNLNNLNKLNKLCLDWNLDPRTKNSTNVTPFHKMCCNGLYQSFMDAYEKYPIDDINMSDCSGTTLLHYTCTNYDKISDDQIYERLQLIRFLIKHPLIDFNRVDLVGNNIFHKVCSFAQMSIIKFFIEEVDLPDHIINGINTSYGETPFHTIIRHHISNEYTNKRVFPQIKYLIKINRIDFLKRNKSGQTPFEQIYNYSNKMDPTNPATEIAQYMIDNIDGIVIPNNKI